MLESNLHITYDSVAHYLEAHPFDLYIVNEYTAPRVYGKSPVLTTSLSDKSSLDHFLNSHAVNYTRIVGIGAGTVIDATKYIATRTKSRYTCIPSALSTNSFATHRNSFFDASAGKVSTNTGVAEDIVIDYAFLSEALPLNLFGLVEIAAVVTAQVDCQIAVMRHGESFDTELLNRAARLPDVFLSLCVPSFNESSYPILLNALLESGTLTRLQGNGRLVSGAEHIISSHIERDLLCPHGMGLLFGVLVTRELQSISGFASATSELVANELKSNLAMRSFILEHASPKDIISAAWDAHGRADKFTILDLPEAKSIYRETLENAVNSYFAAS